MKQFHNEQNINILNQDRMLLCIGLTPPHPNPDPAQLKPNSLTFRSECDSFQMSSSNVIISQNMMSSFRKEHLLENGDSLYAGRQLPNQCSFSPK